MILLAPGICVVARRRMQNAAGAEDGAEGERGCAEERNQTER